MSRKAYTLFYKVAQKLGNSKETSEKLHHVKQSALQVSLVFASTCQSDIASGNIRKVFKKNG